VKSGSFFVWSRPPRTAAAAAIRRAASNAWTARQRRAAFVTVHAGKLLRHIGQDDRMFARSRRRRGE